MANAFQQPWYRRMPRGWQHFQSIPLTRLWPLFVAVFILFSSFGFFNDLMLDGRWPYSITFANACFSGLISCAWILVMSRFAVYWIFALVTFQFLASNVITRIDNRIGVLLPAAPATSTAGIHFAAVGMMICILLSYVCFILFIRLEGRESFRIRNELDLAHGIQKTLVPPVSLVLPEYEVYGLSQPSEKVGGDLVDALVLPGGDAIAYLADIAGHGLQAGILMGMLKTATRTALLEAGECPPAETLPLLLDRLNHVLPEVKEPHMYATFTGLRLGPEGRVHYSLAASPPLLHWHAQGAGLSHLEEEQFPLGLLPVSGFQDQTLEMAPGDLLLVATDGILEVCDRKQQEFGLDRLKGAITSTCALPLAEIASEVLQAARDFGKQADDQTILIVRRKPAPA